MSNAGDLKAKLAMAKKNASSEVSKATTGNAAIDKATGAVSKAPKVQKISTVLLDHDQVLIFPYHDRPKSDFEKPEYKAFRQDIIDNKQKTPGVVRTTKLKTEDGRDIYELVAGRCRFEATKGVAKFKATVEFNLSDTDACRVMLGENEFRQDINPFSRFESIIPIIEDGLLEHQEIAKLIKWDKGNLSRAIKAIPFYKETGLADALITKHVIPLSKVINLAIAYEGAHDKAKSIVQSSLKKNEKDGKVLRALEAGLSRKLPKKEPFVFGQGKASLQKSGKGITMKIEGKITQDDLLSMYASLAELMEEGGAV